ncbi:MAG: fibronectin type III domain-containing protein, partial [Nonlabens sp.]
YTGPFSFSTLPSCGDTIYDTGGPTGNYSNNETYTITYLPENVGDLVTLNFTLVDLEECCDTLEVFDGLDVNAPAFTSDLESPASFRATNVDGAITIRFDSDSSVNAAGWVADYTCAAPPSCDEPTDLSFSAVNSSSFDFTWTDNASASEFIVEYRETGAMAFTTITPNPTTNSVTISSLLSSTEYEVCVTAVCDLAANDLSMQVCGTISTTPDYCGGDLFLDSGGASGQYQSNETITYNICPDNAGDVVYVDFISNQMEDSFAGCWDGLTIYDGPDATFPIITTPNGDNEWCWDDGSGTGDLTLETLIGTSTSGCLTFVWSSDGSGQRDGWEANVTCAPPPACPDVNTLTATQISSSSAVLAWTEVGTASVWQVEVQPTTVAQGTAGAIFEDMAATNPITATGLSSNTTYDYFVRSDCGAGDFSEWIGPFTFTTACDVVTQYPYITDFDLNVPNACWDEAEDGEIADGPMGLGDSEWRARNYTDAAGNLLESNAINLYRAEDREWLISESYDMTGTDNDVLTVEVAVTDWNSNTVGDTMGSDDQVDLLVTTDGGTTWTSLMAWTVANQPAVTGERMTFDLSSYTGTVQFAFLASDGTTNNMEDYDFHVGVFIIDGTASNEDLSSFDFTFYPNPTSDMVNFNGQQVIDAISVKNLLGQQLLITKPNATSSNVDLSTFPSGMYLIEVTSGEQSKVVKVMRK